MYEFLKQETSTNFEQYSTSLNVHLSLLENISEENLNQKYFEGILFKYNYPLIKIFIR